MRALVVGAGGGAPNDNRPRNPGSGGGEVQDRSDLRFVVGSYTVTIGAGGTASTPAGFSEITGVLRSIGGACSTGIGIFHGGDGAHGAGVTQSTATPGKSLIGGYTGGVGNNSSTAGNAGGGAGAGGDGASGASGGGGGPGLSSNITDTPTDYGAGSGRGPTGTATANTGNGGATGGTGVVILRWNPTALANAGLTISFTGGSTTTGLSGGDSIHTWTSSGSFALAIRTDYALSGTVTLAGTPVSGAVIRVIRQSDNTTVDTTTTDGSGNWSMQGVSENELYDVVVEYTNGGTYYNAKNLWRVVPV